MNQSPTVPSGEVAQLTKATVDLVVVRVGKRQMTKAVYNQLPVTTIKALQERGELWGWINVCPTDCSIGPPAERAYYRERDTDDEGYWTTGGHRDAYGDFIARPTRLQPYHKHLVGVIDGTLYRTVMRWYLFRNEENNPHWDMLEGDFVYAADDLPQLYIAV